MRDLLGLSQVFSHIAADLAGHGAEAGLKAACEILREDAQRAIGSYTYGWPSLADSTIAKKGSDTPLLDTSALKSSLEYKVGHREAWFGSNDPKIKFLEWGTSKMPARPLIGGALHATHAQVQACFGEMIKITMERAA